MRVYQNKDISSRRKIGGFALVGGVAGLLFTLLISNILTIGWYLQKIVPIPQNPMNSMPSYMIYDINIMLFTLMLMIASLVAFAMLVYKIKKNGNDGL